MNLPAELDKHVKQKEILAFFEDNYRLRRVPLDELEIIAGLFPLIRSNFRKSWANVESWEFKNLAKATIDEWDYSISLTRDHENYLIRITAPSRSAYFYSSHYGELHDAKVADLIDEAEEIVRETILEKQKQIMQK